MYFPGRGGGALMSFAFNLVSGLRADRKLVVLMAQLLSTTVNAVAQSYWDGKRRQSEDDTAALIRQLRVEATRPAVPPTSLTPTAPGLGPSSGAQTAPPAAFGPNMEKRMLPSGAASLTSLAVLMQGGVGAKSVWGLFQALVQGLLYGGSDAVADRRQTQANLDRQHELSQLPDGHLNAILDGIYRLVAEEHARLSAQISAGVLDTVLDEPTRTALISVWQQTRDLIQSARAPLAAQEQDLRREIRGRRRMHRLIWRGSVGGVANLVGGPVRATTARPRRAVRWVVRKVRRRPGTATVPATTALPPGMPPARQYRWRVLIPYATGGVAGVVTMHQLDSTHLPLAVVTAIATTVAGLGLGQGWADHRRDEVADEIPLATLTALHNANQALDEVERILAALGDATASPVPQTQRGVPSRVHGPSVAIEKHLLALIFRIAAVQALGEVLLDDEVLIAILTGGQIAGEITGAIGEAFFRIRAGRERQDYQEQMAQAEARGLPLTHEEMAEQVRAYVEIAADLARLISANQINPPGGGGAAGGPTGP
jgi:hypothetical protein